jgi:hypothetical protein
MLQEEIDAKSAFYLRIANLNVKNLEFRETTIPPRTSPFEARPPNAQLYQLLLQK